MHGFRYLGTATDGPYGSRAAVGEAPRLLRRPGLASVQGCRRRSPGGRASAGPHMGRGACKGVAAGPTQRGARQSAPRAVRRRRRWKNSCRGIASFGSQKCELEAIRVRGEGRTCKIHCMHGGVEGVDKNPVWFDLRRELCIRVWLGLTKRMWSAGTSMNSSTENVGHGSTRLVDWLLLATLETCG